VGTKLSVTVVSKVTEGDNDRRENQAWPGDSLLSIPIMLQVACESGPYPVSFVESVLSG
jgi:hypothetical protein